jgi:UDP-glucose 4-epimerase
VSPIVFSSSCATYGVLARVPIDEDTAQAPINIRDYIHVTDLASAHVAALSACAPGKFAAYNLGSGQGARSTR